MTMHQTNKKSVVRITDKFIDNHMQLLLSTAGLLYKSVGTIPSQNQPRTKTGLLYGLTKDDLLKILGDLDYLAAYVFVRHLL